MMFSILAPFSFFFLLHTHTESADTLLLTMSSQPFGILIILYTCMMFPWTAADRIDRFVCWFAHEQDITNVSLIRRSLGRLGVTKREELKRERHNERERRNHLQGARATFLLSNAEKRKVG